jgi:hypothetical protein
MRRNRFARLALLSVVLAFSTILAAVPAMAATTTVSWNHTTGLMLVPGTETQVAQLTVPDVAGSTCTVDVETINQASTHPGNNLNVYLNGTLLLSIDDFENTSFEVNNASAGFTSSGSDELEVFVESTGARRSSAQGSLTVNCTEPPPPGGGEGCTPGFWKQSHHFDSWVGHAPGDEFDVVFGVPYDLTLLAALKAGGGDEIALGRHAVAALLNAASPDVDFAFTEAEVIALVQDAWATGDFETAKDILEAENETGCPLS